MKLRMSFELPPLLFSPLSEPVCVKLMAATLIMDQSDVFELRLNQKAEQQKHRVDGFNENLL